MTNEILNILISPLDEISNKLSKSLKGFINVSKIINFIIYMVEIDKLKLALEGHPI